MGALDNLDNFCSPISVFWSRSAEDVCPGLQRNSCHDAVDLTLCFEDTAILYGICFLFWILAGVMFISRNGHHDRLPLSVLHGAKLMLVSIPFVTSLSDLFYTIDLGRKQDVAQFQYLTPVVITITVVLTAIVLTHHRRNGIRSSGLLLTLWLSLAVYGSFKVRTYVLTSEDLGYVDDKFRLTTFSFQYVAYVVLFVLSFFSEPRSMGAYRDPTERRPCPEEEATFLSRITWWWQNSQIWRGWRKPLKYEDLADLCFEDKSRVVAPKFQHHWENELKKARIVFQRDQTMESAEKESQGHDRYQSFNTKWSKPSAADSMEAVRFIPRQSHQEEQRQRKKDPSFVWALFKSFGGTLLVAAFFKLLQDLLAFASPQILRYMIRFTENENEADWLGYFYALLLFIVAVLQSLFLHQYFHRCFLIGLRMRTAVISAVYNKALCLSNRARRNRTTGEIVNLMSVDAQRLMDLMSYVNMIWSAPLQIILSLVFLWFTMGPSIFAGFAVMVLMIPLNAIIAAWSRRLQVKQMGFKDSRIKIVNEVLNGIKVIKLYAWEKPFQYQITGIRQKELEQLKKNAYLNAVSTFTWTCAPFLVSLATFATYALVNLNNPNERLTADRAFVALSLFNILRFPLAMLPMLITSLVQAAVSIKRIKTFLQSEELDPNVVEWSPQKATDHEESVSVNGAQFSWDSENPGRATLSDVNLHIKPGQLVAVVGQVGSGKSSLIQALLGEMDKLGGTVSLKGGIAYVPQQAWIQNSTLKKNILFGKPMDGVMYGATLDACALGPDLEILPGGDMTEIGEKGINLSGGQKHRVSLARAVYQNADVYLLDDPLSAVDSHVGKHIFDKVIGPEGMLKGKVRVLVTHGIGFLPQCDQIVVIVDGRITEVGTYNELLENKEAFAQFLHTFQNTDANEEENPDYIEYSSGDDEPFADTLEDPSTIVSPCPSDDAEGFSRKSERKRDLQKQRSRSRSRSRVMSEVSKRGEVMKRQMSRQHSKQDDKPKKTPTEHSALIAEEKAETGSVKLSVIVAYIKACTWSMSLLTLMLYVLTNGASVASNFWLAEWSTAEGNEKAFRSNKSSTFTQVTACDNNGTGPDIGCYLGIYAGLGLSQALLVLLGAFTLALAAIFASRTLHKNMLKNILRSPMSFFDTVPLGRILNRFSGDIYIIDEVVPRSIRSFIFTFFTVISTIIVILVATPIFAVVILPLGVFYVLIQRFYVATSRQLKRLESISRSPIYSHFQETVLGAASIRAYRQQERFMKESERRVDYNQIAYYPSMCANRWLAIRLEFVGNLIIFFAALFVVIQRNYNDELNLKITPGLVGLSISYALQITQALNWVVRMTSELETNIVAVERTKEYSETPQEAPPTGNILPNDWPSQGHVKFDRYSTRYREGLDLVLRDITIDIPGGTKVGIVGRTGAGKSSLTLALFRIIEAARGAVLVDNINIANYDLEDIRSKLTIIPQDPVLFSGTLRLNLDPFENYSDEEVWQALECAHLKNYASSLEKGLYHIVSEGGENLSVGQRQLVCLARALLRKTKILVLDEATAAVDLETDDLIQKTIRTEFADCTIITIAHRLNTIIDYDFIIVLDAGRMVEYDSPEELLNNRKSIFFSMAKDAGLVS